MVSDFEGLSWESRVMDAHSVYTRLHSIYTMLYISLIGLVQLASWYLITTRRAMHIMITLYVFPFKH